MNAAYKQFRNRCGSAMMVYVALVIAAKLGLEQTANPVMQHFLALAPVIPLMAAGRAVLVYVRAIDEVERAILAEAAIISFIVLVFATQGYGFLETFLDYPSLPVLMIFPVLAGTFWLAFFFVRKSYS